MLTNPNYISSLISKQLLQLLFTGESKIELLKQCKYKIFIGDDKSKLKNEKGEIDLTKSILKYTKFLPTRMIVENDNNISLSTIKGVSIDMLKVGHDTITNYVVEVDFNGEKHLVYKEFAPQRMTASKIIIKYVIGI